MGVTEKTAILVISFGTSYEETRKKTIEQIESDLHHAFPEYPLYRAWTSPRIRAKLQKRDGIHIMDIDEAMTQLKADGIRNVIVQPTYVITGFDTARCRLLFLRERRLCYRNPLQGGSAAQ